MEHPSLGLLFTALAGLLILAAFFAGSETALMSLNRYRLRHRASEGSRGARLAEALLQRPDRLIGLILLLSTLVNVAAPILVGFIALKLGGEFLVAFGAALLAFVLLIFCEVAPKTFGALHPERLALPAAYIYTPLLFLLYPFVWFTNLLANGVLRMFGVSRQVAATSLSSEELRTVVAEAGAMIPRRHQQMLVSILDLENATVEDIMVPRNEIVGIDIDDDWDRIMEQLRQSQHTRLPVYQGEIDRIIGLLHMKQVVHELARGHLDLDTLTAAAQAREPYFVPSGTTLNTQLLNFQRNKRRMAFVVDEYGDIQGLVTIEDILEEIVGEFTTDPATMMHKDVHAEADGSFVASASATIRALNRSMRWNLPTDGPKTLNGLIVEFLETIPEPGTTLKMADYMLEVLQTGDNAIKTVRIRPPEANAALKPARRLERLQRLIQARHAAHAHSFRRPLRHIRFGNQRHLESMFCSLAQPFLAEGHRTNFAGESQFAKHNQRTRHGRVIQATERAAITIARSPAVSARRTPPTTFANTSCPCSMRPPWRCATASSMVRRLPSMPTATRRGLALKASSASTCTSISSERVPSRITVMTLPGTGSACRDKKIADGFVTSRRPCSSMANTPISLAAPNRFFTERSTR